VILRLLRLIIINMFSMINQTIRVCQRTSVYNIVIVTILTLPSDYVWDLTNSWVRGARLTAQLWLLLNLQQLVLMQINSTSRLWITIDNLCSIVISIAPSSDRSKLNLFLNDCLFWFLKMVRLRINWSIHTANKLC